jgi:lipopolysaccharide biosynthesis glycosyltransferase
MDKKKNAVMIADSRPSLVGIVLLQLQETNKGLFDEAVIYYIEEIPEGDRNLMSSIMSCRFIKYAPQLSDRLFDLPRFKRFSKLMFARYEMFSLLNEYETVTWTDTDILIQNNIADILDLARITGCSMVREDLKNKTAKNTDYMKTCFIKSPGGNKYNLQSYLFPSGLIAVSDKLGERKELTKYCYDKTVEWAEILDLPDQGVLNAMVQDFDISVSCIRGSDYCCYPYYNRDCSDVAIIHSWGNNKFWNDWYLYNLYPAWREYHNKWVALGGGPLKKDFHPAISILIPVFKPNIDWFKKCLDSIIGQVQNGWERYSDFEIIVISEPENGKNIHSFLNSYVDPRIILFVNDKRLGISGSLNRGMRIARGDYIARIDADDLMVQDRMFKQKKYLDKNPEVTLCTSDFEYFGDIHEYRGCFSNEMSRACSVIACPFDHPTIMFRREFFLKNDLFYDEGIRYAEDWEFWLRAFEKGMVVHGIPEMLTLHRWHINGTCRTKSTIVMMCELMKKNMKRLDVDVPNEVLSYLRLWSGKTKKCIYRKLDALFAKALVNNYKMLLYNPDSLKTIFEYRLHEAKTGKFPKEVAGHMPPYILSETFFLWKVLLRNIRGKQKTIYIT